MDVHLTSVTVAVAVVVRRRGVAVVVVVRRRGVAVVVVVRLSIVAVVAHRWLVPRAMLKDLEWCMLCVIDSTSRAR